MISILELIRINKVQRKRSYSPLRDLTMSNFAALTDGKNPPKMPITIANIMEIIAEDGDNARLNVNSEKLV
jgi:hypothetical protein